MFTEAMNTRAEVPTLAPATTGMASRVVNTPPRTRLAQIRVTALLDWVMAPAPAPHRNATGRDTVAARSSRRTRRPMACWRCDPMSFRPTNSKPRPARSWARINTREAPWGRRPLHAGPKRARRRSYGRGPRSKRRAGPAFDASALQSCPYRWQNMSFCRKLSRICDVRARRRPHLPTATPMLDRRAPMPKQATQRTSRLAAAVARIKGACSINELEGDSPSD